ncbi:phosphodiester glycosidase family protein [Candidatus Gottesmanbacteria bacterium]|nr:phosphodiester glycosidase family protein [Candidatus Gottesmanbacteria bacterium]
MEATQTGGNKKVRIVKIVTVLFIVLSFIGSTGYSFYLFRQLESLYTQNNQANEKIKELDEINTTRIGEIRTLTAENETLKKEDLRLTNDELRLKVDAVEKSFSQVAKLMEQLSDLRAQKVAVNEEDKKLAAAVNLLSKLEYNEATASMASLSQELIKKTQVQSTVVNVPISQNLPAAGTFSKQIVSTSRGNFVISLIGAQAGSIRMITDTANDDTCTDNCPVKPLAEYVSRNGGFAGINGTYFCPPDYPSCAGQVNSFNTLIFNSRSKKYLNSDQNVYSVVPMVVQNADRSMRFMERTLEWGRDTGIIGGIANHPLLVIGGSSRVDEGSLDEKSRSTKTNRGFIGFKSGTLYIGVIQGATIGDAAHVLVALGIESAVNLDGGGSSALFYNGRYVVGPGRNLPNAIVLVNG